MKGVSPSARIISFAVCNMFYSQSLRQSWRASLARRLRLSRITCDRAWRLFIATAIGQRRLVRGILIVIFMSLSLSVDFMPSRRTVDSHHTVPVKRAPLAFLATRPSLQSESHLLTTSPSAFPSSLRFARLIYVRLEGIKSDLAAPVITQTRLLAAWSDAELVRRLGGPLLLMLCVVCLYGGEPPSRPAHLPGNQSPSRDTKIRPLAVLSSLWVKKTSHDCRPYSHSGGFRATLAINQNLSA